MTAGVLSPRAIRCQRVFRVSEVPMLRVDRLSMRFSWGEKIFPALRAAAGVLSLRAIRCQRVFRVSEVPVLRAGRLSRASSYPSGVS